MEPPRIPQAPAPVGATSGIGDRAVSGTSTCADDLRLPLTAVQQDSSSQLPAWSFPGDGVSVDVLNLEDEATVIGGVPVSPRHDCDHGQAAWRRCCLGGNDHGPLDQQKCLKIGGLGFAPVYNEMENMQRRDEKRWVFGLMSVGLQALAGVLTGIFAYFVGHVSQLLCRARLEIVLAQMAEGSLAQAWFASFGCMLALSMAASLPIVFLGMPGSSGIPAIVGILNGIDLRGDFSLSALAARLFGVTCAVASGLAAGPEGPMIFIGACTGALLSRLPTSPTLIRHLGRPPCSVNQHVYLRDYISTGAACGIAAAFRAPVAGALFVVEEAASHFRREHLAKIFFGALLSMVVAGWLVGVTAVDHGGYLFEYKVKTADLCMAWQPFDFVVFAFIGVVCGVGAALFNAINIWVCGLRARYVTGKMRFRRLADVALLCLLTSTCWVALPRFVQERPATSMDMMAGSMACLPDRLTAQITQGAYLIPQPGDGAVWRYFPEPCLFGVQYNQSLCPQAHAMAQDGNFYALMCTEALFRGTRIANRTDKTSYCCNFSTADELARGHFQLPRNASCRIDLGDSYPGLTRRSSTPGQKTYNPMAALTLVPLDEAAKNLFSRGAPFLMDLPALLMFLPVFFLLAALTSGSAVPTGLLLPMIVIGACIGRIVVVALLQIQLSLGQNGHQLAPWAAAWLPFLADAGGPVSSAMPLTSTGWLDPGIGALVGAAAFLGGCSRISLMITVMMVEITGDPTTIAPVGVATLVAVIVGNRFNHGIYHSLIDIASFPFLPDRWPKGFPKALRVEHLLARRPTEVVSVSLSARRNDLENVLEGNGYSCFPVLDQNGVAVGLASRTHLEYLLSLETDTVDVGWVLDFNYVTIRASLPLEVAYNLFKRMEVSHLVVVDDNHRPTAMLTRGSFLPWSVEQTIGFPRLMAVRRTIRRPRSLRGAGPGTLFMSTFGGAYGSQEDGDGIEPPRQRGVTGSSFAD